MASDGGGAGKTTAQVMADVLAAYGVARLFGLPGGGSNLEMIDSCAALGIDYVLAHTECAAGIMAATDGNIGNRPGVVCTGLGPGAAAVTNAVAYASLDRSPLLVLTDSYQPGEHDHILHQTVDHTALFGTLVKASRRATPETAGETLAELLELALAAPVGPVHMDLSAVVASKPGAAFNAQPSAAPPALEGDAHAARELLGKARRPAIVAGIQCRNDEAAAAVARLADRLACPVLTSYKAKGVYPDGAPRHAGRFTGARAEAEWLADCDLLILVGMDPVELVASPWPYDMPVLELAEVEIRPHYTTPAVSLFGPLPDLAEAVIEAARPANWPGEPAPLTLAEAGEGLTPQAVVRAAIDAAPPRTRLTIDAGAHMLPPMSLWPAKAPFDVQISNGLSTMAFALPAAIATALAEPDRRVLAITGDGGLAMCLGELATAARNNVAVTVIVLNDAALSLIDVKQEQRGFERRGMRYPGLDFATIAKGSGCRAAVAKDEDALAAAMAEAFQGEGPMLIDARIDASGYRAMFEAIRGAPGVAANA